MSGCFHNVTCRGLLPPLLPSGEATCAVSMLCCAVGKSTCAPRRLQLQLCLPDWHKLFVVDSVRLVHCDYLRGPFMFSGVSVAFASSDLKALDSEALRVSNMARVHKLSLLRLCGACSWESKRSTDIAGLSVASVACVQLLTCT